MLLDVCRRTPDFLNRADDIGTAGHRGADLDKALQFRAPVNQRRKGEGALDIDRPDLRAVGKSRQCRAIDDVCDRCQAGALFQFIEILKVAANDLPGTERVDLLLVNIEFGQIGLDAHQALDLVLGAHEKTHIRRIFGAE